MLLPLVDGAAAGAALALLLSPEPVLLAAGLALSVDGSRLAISVQTFPEDYLELPVGSGNRDPWRGNVMALATAAAARLRR